jgi:hypothetical protein
LRDKDSPLKIRTMTRSAASTFILFSAPLLAACWGGGDTGSSGPVPQESVTSRFFAGTPSRIEMVIVDPLPVESARLVTADGVPIAAKEIVREKNAYADEGDNLPHVAVGAAGGSQTRVTTGIGIEFPFLGGSGTQPRAVSMTTSRITFTVPDRAAYEETWQRWVLHVDLSDGTNRRAIETLPPKPPR